MRPFFSRKTAKRAEFFRRSRHPRRLIVFFGMRREARICDTSNGTERHSTTARSANLPIKGDNVFCSIGANRSYVTRNIRAVQIYPSLLDVHTKGRPENGTAHPNKQRYATYFSTGVSCESFIFPRKSGKSKPTCLANSCIGGSAPIKRPPNPLSPPSLPPPSQTMIFSIGRS